MVLAFKEWSYIVDALGKGLQNIIFRKGGIAEEEGHFTVRGNKFILFPTLFHQATKSIKPEWLGKLDGEQFHTQPNHVKIEYYAQVLEQRLIKDWAVIEKFYQHHAWSKDIIEERYNRWERNVNLLLVQVYKLPTPQIILLKPEYEGCKSWIELDEEIALSGKPVIPQSIKGSYF
ncbi:MAG TPA: DUF1802 family protein [Cytophagaceae bacterium]|jgi:hypothetical protein